MPSIELKYTFKSEEELRLHLGSTTIEKVDNDLEVADESVTERQETTEEAEVDSDGMPWNEEYHSGSKGKNADGTWKARQGKAQAAKDARAAFKAGGGDVDAPEVETEEVKSVPTLPGVAALPEDAPAPVTWERMIEKITGMMERGLLAQPKMMDLYSKHGGDDPVTVLEINETARAALFADLLTIEPEL